MSAPARTPVALLTRVVGDDPSARRRLADAGLDVVLDIDLYNQIASDPERWPAGLAEVEGLIVGLQPIDRAVLAAAPRLRAIVRVGTGLDSIDVVAARDRGISVTALPGINATAVAEYTFGLLLAAARRLLEADASVRRGEWARFNGRQVSGGTLGLVGFGAIPRVMVPMARGFNMTILANRRRLDEPAPADVSFVELDELLIRADFVSVHTPLTETTRNLIGADQIALMDNTVLVNTARGGVIDEDALLLGLEQGHVAAAALDVFTQEPPVRGPLLDHPRVVLSPHNAARADVAIARTAHACVDALLNALVANSSIVEPTH